jgi:hypothetical protein
VYIEALLKNPRITGQDANIIFPEEEEEFVANLLEGSDLWAGERETNPVTSSPIQTF